MLDLILGDLRRATADLPDSAPVHLADPETLRALGEPVVWEGALYLPILEPTTPTPSPIGIQMRWADEALGWRLHTEEDGYQGSMTVREFVALLQEWPLNAPITFGNAVGRPPQYADGDPVTVDGVTLPDGLYIGWLTDAQRSALGWQVQP